MNKFLIAAVAAFAANVVNLFVASALVGFLAAVGVIYLGIYGAIMLGYGLANSFMLITVEKTLNQNTESNDPKRYDRNAKCLFAGYACIALMILLLVTKLMAVAIIFGIVLAWVLVIGYQANRWYNG